jgi:hypothetical protein
LFVLRCATSFNSDSQLLSNFFFSISYTFERLAYKSLRQPSVLIFMMEWKW